MKKTRLDYTLTRVICIAAIALIFPVMALARPGINSNGSLDMQTVRQLYGESEFVKSREILEGFLKRSRVITMPESVFAFKYLGVIYAADSSTSVLAESYFNRALRLAPDLELVDMFVPAKILSLFDKVKRDVKHQQEYKSKFDELGQPLQADAPHPRPGPTPRPVAKEKKETSLFWPVTLGVGAMAIGAGIVWVYLAQDAPKSAKRDSVRF